MILSEWRVDIASFFLQTCDTTINICEANHFCTNDIKKFRESLKKPEICPFNKIIIDTIQKDYAKAVAMCTNWKKYGLDIVLCSLIENRTIQEDQIRKAWEKNNLDELTQSVSHMGCREMIKLCEKTKSGNAKYVACGFVMYLSLIHI